MMKTTRNTWMVVMAIAAGTVLVLATSANAAIVIVNQVEGFRGSDKAQVTTAHNGAIEISYDATGVDKLVVAIGTESGFNNQKVTSVGVMFNGVPLTLAVQDNFAPPTDSAPFSGDGGYAGIFYLDNPFQGAATFSLTTTTTGGGPNGGHVSIIGLAGTAEGVGNTAATWTSQTSAGNVSTSITTSANDALVIAGVENSGTNNSAGTPNVVAPLTLSNNGFWGSQWGGAASGYQFVPTSGTTITPTFSTNAGFSIHVIAAEFLPAAQEGTLHIFKYFDVNGNGVMDQDEMLMDPGMFQFEIFDAAGALVGTFPNSQEIMLDAGLYTGQEILFGDWVPTTPNPFEFEIVGGQLTEVFVGNVPEPSTLALLGLALVGLLTVRRKRS